MVYIYLLFLFVVVVVFFRFSFDYWCCFNVSELKSSIGGTLIGIDRMLANAEKQTNNVGGCGVAGPGAEIYAALSGLMGNGIEVDKNLRQPTFYTWLTYDELKIDSFWIITDLLDNQ